MANTTVQPQMLGGPVSQNPQVISTNYTIPTNTNAVTVGPITIASGVTITLASGSRWVIL